MVLVLPNNSRCSCYFWFGILCYIRVFLCCSYHLGISGGWGLLYQSLAVCFDYHQIRKSKKKNRKIPKIVRSVHQCSKIEIVFVLHCLIVFVYLCLIFWVRNYWIYWNWLISIGNCWITWVLVRIPPLNLHRQSFSA